MNIDIKDNDDKLIRKVGKLLNEFHRTEITVWGSFNNRVCKQCFVTVRTNTELLLWVNIIHESISAYYNYFSLTESRYASFLFRDPSHRFGTFRCNWYPPLHSVKRIALRSISSSCDEKVSQTIHTKFCNRVNFVEFETPRSINRCLDITFQLLSLHGYNLHQLESAPSIFSFSIQILSKF